MYICKDCGTVFEDAEEKKIVEHHSELDQGNKNEVGYIKICPNCHGEDIEPADQCTLTGEYGDYGGHNLSPESVKFLGDYISDMSKKASEIYRKPIAECDILDALSEYIEMR